MFVLIDQSGEYVAGFNEEHQIVQTTTDRAFVKRFETASEADEWAKSMVGTGVGLASYTVTAMLDRAGEEEEP